MSSDPLRVLFITHSFPLSGTGPQSDALHLLADALAAQGVEVRVVAPDMYTGKAKGAVEVGDTGSAGEGAAGKGDDSRVERFRVETPRARVAKAPGELHAAGTPAKGSPAARASRKTALNYLGAGFGSAVKARRDFKPDVVHAHWWFPSGLVGSWVSSLASLPLVTSLHGFDATSGRAGSPTRPLFRHVLRRSAAITVESNAEAQRLSSVLDGVSPIIAPLPIAVDVFRPADVKRNAVAMVVSPELAREGTQLITSLRMLSAFGVEVTLVGESGDENALRVGILAAGPNGKTAFVSTSNREALAKALGEARACVVLGASEDQRATVSAAMLAGAPPAFLQGAPASDVLAEHFRLAVQLEGADFGERTTSLQQLLSEPEGLKAQGDAARMYALSTLAPESCAARMLGAYLRALDDAAA